MTSANPATVTGVGGKGGSCPTNDERTHEERLDDQADGYPDCS